MNAARDLANTGTPGPWKRGEYAIRTLQPGLPSASIVAAFHYTADGTKIARAVNVLPLVADLLDALQEEDEHRVECAACVGCTPGNTLWIVAMVAREQLTAALRGES